MSETEHRPESKLGLYLSIPFCRAKCSFCNFASGVGSAEAVERYVGLLCEEIRGARAWARGIGAELPERVDTVYFGGGTPSLLEPRQMKAVMDAVRGEFALEAGAEITMEAAPGQIGEGLLDGVLALGVNRVSLGVQSFVDREAQAVGRTHTEGNCLAEFARLRRAGVGNLGADLIAGLPYQTEASWDHSLDVAVGAGLDHLSVYMLEIDEESRLGREVLGGGARLHAPAVASEELVGTLYERACEVLPDAGFGQYETSNFAAEGYRSRHNLKYWMREPYLGSGLDASSMLMVAGGGAVRFSNPDELDRYAGATSVREPEWITERAAFEETVFLGLRLAEGLRWERLSRFPGAWLAEVSESMAGLCHEDLMGMDRERLWLTARGRMVSGEIFGELLAGVAA
ncbi:MAG TPA: radical SAM family heme chaperone HemW [Acidobacteriaceae bacterium]|nr:radical SAM family heme chaperone HemW [Acidobacteriaceae bacterium]